MSVIKLLENFQPATSWMRSFLRAFGAAILVFLKIVGVIAASVIGFAVLMWVIIVGGAQIIEPKASVPPPATALGKPTDRDPLVYNSGWDGSVRQIERWLHENLKDPDSFKAIEWSPVIKVPDGVSVPHKFVVRVKYRAKNSYGGYVIENRLFYLDKNGDVLNVKPVENLK